MTIRTIPPRFEGNFTIHTRGLTAQQRSDVMELAITENLQWSITGDSKRQDAFIMIHTPNPPGPPTQQTLLDKNAMVLKQLARLVVPFVFTPEGNPHFPQDIKDTLENLDSLTRIRISEFNNPHEIFSHYVDAAGQRIRGFAWKPINIQP